MRRYRCRCVWAGKHCPNDATQEDGLCDWCGTRRPEQLRANPKAIIDPTTGKVLGLGGANEPHSDATQTPDACWMPNSGRRFSELVIWRDACVMQPDDDCSPGLPCAECSRA